MMVPSVHPILGRLVEAGLISNDDVDRLLAESDQTYQQIGQLLMSQKLLTVKQVMSVLAHQAEFPQQRFGDIAVALGYIRSETIEWALQRRTVQQRHVLDRLIERQLVPERVLLSVLVEYIKYSDYAKVEDEDESLQRARQSA